MEGLRDGLGSGSPEWWLFWFWVFVIAAVDVMMELRAMHMLWEPSATQLHPSLPLAFKGTSVSMTLATVPKLPSLWITCELKS